MPYRQFALAEPKIVCIFVLKKPVTLFVGNLSKNTTPEDLYQLFSKFGNVQDVKIINGTNYGFVASTIIL